MEILNYVSPTDLSTAYSLVTEKRENKIIAGGAWQKISLKKVDTLISLDNLGLSYIKEENAYVEIGAMTVLREIEVNKAIKAIASGILSEAIGHIMGIAVRNIATIGGSVMGKFAFSDLLGVLLVLDARLEFYKLKDVSVFDFMNMKKIPEDILLNIKIPKENVVGYFKKVAKTHLDFAVLNIAISKGDGFKIAVGSRPTQAVLAINTANYLNSKKEIDDLIIEETIDIALDEISVRDNVRGSKEYRELLLKTYLKRGLKEVMR